MERSLTCPQVAGQEIDGHQQLPAQQRPGKVTWRAKLYRWRQLSRERNALRHLSDDRLNDIGISRDAVQRESRRPFWDDRGWRR